MKIRKIAQTPGLVATVVDNLTSTSSIDALSANQGKVLNDKINDLTTYSTSETKTGETWIDGKPIYQCVATLSSISVGQQKTGAMNVSNVDKVISQISNGFNGTNYVRAIDAFMYKSGSSYRYSFYTASENLTDCYLIVKYTKTTD